MSETHKRWKAWGGTNRHARSWSARSYPNTGTVYGLRPDLFLAVREMNGATIKGLAENKYETSFFNRLRDAKAWIDEWVDQGEAELEAGFEKMMQDLKSGDG